MSAHVKSMVVQPCRRLRGEISMPGDKSISHRVGMLASIAAGRSTVHNYLRSEDCLCTLRAMQALGARADFAGETLYITGNGGNLMQPVGPLDMGNSGTGLRLLTGLLAGRMVDVTLTGDDSLRSRPMGRIKDPLDRMGASIELLGEKGCAPVRVRGGSLKAIAYDLPVASAQVKSCLLFAGLCAAGTTKLREKLPTRDHTERLLAALGVPVQTQGLSVTLEGAGPKGPVLKAAEWRIPGDISSAAFWLVAAAAKEGAEVTIRGVGLNPRRTALLDVLRRMGADVSVQPASPADFWEPYGDITVRGRPLRATTIGGAEIPNLIDELPILAAAGALAAGDTEIRDAAELRVKESDRIATMATGLRQMGVEVEERPDGLRVRGPAKLVESPALRSHGDHRVAMALAVLALFAPAPCAIGNVACVDTSYPTFWDDLAKLTA